MLAQPTRFLTALLMLPTWGFAHWVILFRILPGKYLIFAGDKSHYGHPLLILSVFCAVFASFMAARRATNLGWRLPRVLAVLIHVPIAGAGFALWLAATGEAHERKSAVPTAVAGQLVVPFLLGTLACIALSVGLYELEIHKKIPFGLGKYRGWCSSAIFAVLPFATGMSSGVLIRRAGGTFSQAVASAMAVIGTVIPILCAIAFDFVSLVLKAAPWGALLSLLGAAAGYFSGRSKATDGAPLSAD